MAAAILESSYPQTRTMTSYIDYSAGNTTEEPINSIDERNDERKPLVRNVLGQKVLVPDILSLMPAWPSNVQPDVDEINLEVDEWLKT